eukprot:7328364-Pyramimonas_sp.AAC.1
MAYSVLIRNSFIGPTSAAPKAASFVDNPAAIASPTTAPGCARATASGKRRRPPDFKKSSNLSACEDSSHMRNSA